MDFFEKVSRRSLDKVSKNQTTALKILEGFGAESETRTRTSFDTGF